MNNHIDLKSHVSRVIETEWPAFAAEHPRLAAVIDEELLIQRATESLRDDPQFAHTLATAAAAGIMLDAVQELLRRRIRAWLAALW